MSIYEDTNPRELKKLLDEIDTGDSVLPDFQRDFVWEASATQELIISIAQDYPAGSLLRIGNTQNLFPFRAFAGAPRVDRHRPKFLVLDGQQRLTSLYQAFYGVGDHRYYLRVGDLLDGKDFEECIFHLRENHRRARRYADTAIQFRELILPLSVLKGGSSGYLDWAFEAARDESVKARGITVEILKSLDDRWIKTIDRYLFPVVTLNDSTSPEAVCTIFETLNRTGVKLSPFELLTARFFPQKLYLRNLWDDAKATHKIIEDFDIDPYYVLQIISLLCRAAPSCKRKDIFELKKPDIDTWWPRAIKGLADALALLRDHCAVLTPEWLPYNTLIIPLAAVFAKADITKPGVGAANVRLAQWFWCSVLGQTYENAPNSQAAKDVTEVIPWIEGRGDPPEAIASFKFDPRSLRDTTVRQRALYRGLICLVLSSGPKGPLDFYSGARLTSDLVVNKKVDSHHIFPQNYLKNVSPKPSGRLIECVLNRTLIDRETNQRISDRAPSKYLAEILKEYEGDPVRGPQAFNDLLQSHMMPSQPDSPLWRDDFSAFLDWRGKEVWEQIKRVTGVKEEADLIEEEAPA